MDKKLQIPQWNPEFYCVQPTLRDFCLITQLLEPLLQVLPQLPSLSYDELPSLLPLEQKQELPR